ncbi:hypothetical protein WHJ98_14465, partial [Staphylococcus aureus]|uniref:hypothetical protein n=1 Tax=Staphylococcus aureus TaxID=1280 RepID=UPI0039BDC590
TYANTPSLAQLASLGSSPTLAQLQALITPSSSDTTTLTIRNAAGLVTGSVDNQGDVTINDYDASGNETSSRTYANRLTGLQLDQLVLDPTLANLQAMLVPSTSDTLSVTIHGADGQVLGQATTGGAAGENGVDLMTYDANGNLLATQHYG